MDRLISLSEAVSRLDNAVAPMPTMEIGVLQSYGRVLAKDVVARFDMPPFPRAMLDGFAVIADDTRSASREHPVRLQIAATIPAGQDPDGQCKPGTAYRTMTGAPIAPGADAIVRLEHAQEVRVDGKRYVDVFREVQPGEAIQPQGHDMLKESSMLEAGTRIGPVDMGTLAMHGYQVVSVHDVPRVAIVATGSELVHADEPLTYGKLYDSNTALLAGILSAVGIPHVGLVPVSDDPAHLAKRFSEALNDCDLLVTTGGVSVGDYDLVPSVLESLGVRRIFWGVRMRPGTPVYAGLYDGKVVLALSGNPAAAYVNAHVFLLPVLARMMGKGNERLPKVVSARMRHWPNKRRANLTRFLRGRLVVDGAELWIDLHPEQSSGSLGSFLGMTGLAQIEPEADLTDGTLVPVYLTVGSI